MLIILSLLQLYSNCLVMLKVVYFCGGFGVFLNLHSIITWGNPANSAKAFSIFFIDPNHIATWLGCSVVGLH